MSVTEIVPRNGDFERTPPHDVAAEQCVLGGMLLSKDAISDVIEVIRPTDYYRPAHQLVHEAILDLYGRGEPADAITVANELTRRGEIARVGGGVYLHTLIASVPTAANAGYYARIVRERAIRAARRRPAPGSSSSATPATPTPTTSWTGPRPRCSRSPTAAPARTTTRCRRSCRAPWTRSRRSAAAAASDRRPYRLRRPGRPHQRPAPRPDDRDSSEAGGGQGPGPGYAAADTGRVDHDGRGPRRR